MYEIQFEKRALDILNKLQECKQEPFKYLKHLEQIKGYKLRVGNYRLIIDVQKEIKVLYVLKIDKRSRVYD